MILILFTYLFILSSANRILIFLVQEEYHRINSVKLVPCSNGTIPLIPFLPLRIILKVSWPHYSPFGLFHILHLC